ncbi:MAG TPA: hypothetical protein VIG99_05135 [Myxococcaceae bacterium]|jgi:hypothetical protein
MTTRPLKILQRFPAHLEPARSGKQLWSVVEALAGDLDVLSTDLAGVRRSHRLKDADTLRDLKLLAGLHGLDLRMMEVFFARAARVRALVAYMLNRVAAHDAANRDLSASYLFTLWHTSGSGPPGPRLALYAPPHDPGDPPDLDAAAQNLAKVARDSISSRALLEAARAQVRQVCIIHNGGNGTVRALLAATANALDMDIDDATNAEVMGELVEKPNELVDLTRTDGFFHSVDRYVHLTHARDRLQPAPPPGLEELPYDPEVLGLEENPVDQDIALGLSGPGVIGQVAHQALFAVMRRGFANEELTVKVTGLNGLTTNFQFVHRDEGKGLCYMGTVPDGQTLTIDGKGKFTLGGVDVSNKAFVWEGGCFGDAANPSNRDFCFDAADPDDLPEGSHPAKFATTTPPGALGSGAVFPHPPVPLSGVGIALGLNRFAFFVKPPDAQDPSAKVADLTLTWPEHLPHVLKLWIPGRFFWPPDYPPAGTLAADEETVAQKLARALERFRPMGVQVQVWANDVYQEQIKAMLSPPPTP